MANAIIIPQGFIFGGTYKAWEHEGPNGALFSGQAVNLHHEDPTYPGQFFLDVERFGQCAIPDDTFRYCEQGAPILYGMEDEAQFLVAGLPIDRAPSHELGHETRMLAYWEARLG